MNSLSFASLRRRIRWIQSPASLLASLATTNAVLFILFLCIYYANMIYRWLDAANSLLLLLVVYASTTLVAFWAILRSRSVAGLGLAASLMLLIVLAIADTFRLQKAIIGLLVLTFQPCSKSAEGETTVCLATKTVFGEILVVRDPSHEIERPVHERSTDWRFRLEQKRYGELSDCTQTPYPIESDVYQIYLYCGG